MYLKSYEIRWNDLDANGHLGNSSYIEYMSHTRMSFFTENGFDLHFMKSYGLGPIVINEQIHYFKEYLTQDRVYVGLEVSGMTDDGQFVTIEHNFYNELGRHMAQAEMLFSFINLNTRKLGVIPEEVSSKIKNFPKSKHFKFFTREDIRTSGKRPVNINPEKLN